MFSVFGFVKSSQREFLFILCDLLAKFLPVSFFLNTVSLPLQGPLFAHVQKGAEKHR